MARISSVVNGIEFKSDNSCKLIKLEYLEFKNLMIYGDGNYINFDKFKNIVGLSGKCNIGKSAIIDILAFAIYGECIRGLETKSDIIRLGETKYETVVRLDVNGKKYTIKRIGTVQNKKVKKKGSHINKDPNKKIDKVNKIYAYEEVKFIENGNSRDLTPSDAKSEIETKICPLDYLKRTAIIMKNDDNSFISLNEKKKKELVCKFGDIEIFDIVASKFNSLFTTTTRSKTQAEGEIREFSKYGETVTSIINNNKGAVTKATQDKELEESRISTLLEHVNRLEIAIAETHVRIDLIKRSRDYNPNINLESIDNLKIMITHERTRRNDLNEELSTLINESTSLTDTLTQYGDPDAILKRFNETKAAKINEYTLKLNELWKSIVNDANTNLTKKQIAANETEIAAKLRLNARITRKLKSDLQEIQDYIDDVCIDEKFEEEFDEYLTKLRAEKEIIQLRLDKKKYQLELLNIELFKANDDRKQLEAAKNNKFVRKQIKELSSKLNKLINFECVDYDMCITFRNWNDTYRNRIESTKDMLFESSVILNNLEDQLRSAMRHQNAVKEISGLLKLIEKHTIELQLTRNKIADQQNTLNTATQIYKDVVSDNEKITRLKACCDEYEKDIQEYAIIIRIFGDKDDGIINDLLSNKVMPKLESIVNQLCKNIDHPEMGLSFKDGDFSIYKKDGGTKIYMNGDHVKHITNMVLRVAMMQINSYVKTNFIIIDEIFDGSSSSDKKNIIKLMDQLKLYYDFAFIISHDLEIKANYDQTLQIDYDGKRSKITV
jgi:hypothetical protein